VDALVARAGLDGTQRVLDIGCGTGQITIPLARHAQAVVAIDPVAGMLARGAQAARAAGAGNITWLEGDSGLPGLSRLSTLRCLRSLALLHVLCIFRLLPHGFTNAVLRHLPTGTDERRSAGCRRASSTRTPRASGG